MRIFQDGNSTKMESLSLLLRTLPQAQAGEGEGRRSAGDRSEGALGAEEGSLGLRGRTQRFLKIFTDSFLNNGREIGVGL